MQCETLPELLLAQAERYPEAPYVRFLNRGETESSYTYAETWDRAARWASALHERRLARDEVVALALPNGPDFVGAYYGVLLAGGIPTPLPPLHRVAAEDPRVAQLAQRMARTDARLVVVPEDQAAVAAVAELSAIDRVGAVTAADLPPSPAALPAFRRQSELGLLQFTSGTTGSAKPVELGQDALLAQTRAIDAALGLDRDVDWALSWLPLYHDMGLIGFLLTPAYAAGLVVLMPTEDFIRTPGLWISGLAASRASITGGPPSAYHLCARRQDPAEVERYDLSRIRIALVGAEPVGVQSLDMFASTYRSAGFRRESLMPTYGMAENGLAVTMPPCGRGPIVDTVDLEQLQGRRRAVPARDGAGRPFVSVGRPIDGTRVGIVDELGRPLGERQVGEISIGSPSLMRGYRGSPEATAQAIDGGALRSGDLGYFSDGELYVVGRTKEMLIVGGRNYWPGDLEEAIADLDGIHRGRVVAISYDDAERATEAVAIIAETTVREVRARDELRLRIRRALAASGYPVHDVVLLPPKSIETTLNGKLKRADCRMRYLAREFVDAG